MGEGGLRYDRMVERALRGVMHDALVHVAKHGLPGAHHFYITFRTDHAKVQIDQSLKTRFPQEMTIVLQHQFWDLSVEHDGFVVTLSFNNVPQRLTIPFAAVTAFTDPSVNFGLQFQAVSDGAGTPKPAPAAIAKAAEPPKPGAAKSAKPASVTQLPKPADAPAADAPAAEKVVTLDSFRKK
ncbi:MAG: hypothetical protein IT563_15530 [Alphaproteobacteria bacterium]|nr:hypothetical protein [Alphaproteobacteria bacterium]